MDANTAKHLSAINKKSEPQRKREEFRKYMQGEIQSSVNIGLNIVDRNHSKDYFGKDNVNFVVKELKSLGYKISLDKKRIEVKW